MKKMQIIYRMKQLLENPFLNLFKKSLDQTILSSNPLKAFTVIAFLLSVGSSYAIVKISGIISRLADTIATNEFEIVMKTFCWYSTIALLLKFIPRTIYNCIIQEICRNQFVTFVREYLSLEFPTFHSRTPGEMRYSIFLKSFASVMCSQMILFDCSTMLGTAIFSFTRISSSNSLLIALIFVTMIPLYLSAVAYLISIKLKYQTKFLLQQEKISSSLYDKLINYDVIKAFSLENIISDEFHDELLNQMNAQVDLGVVDTKIYIALNCLIIFPYIAIVLVLINKKGLFETTILYLNLSSQLKRLGREISNLMMYLNQIRFADVDIPPVATDIEKTDELTGFNNSIEFKDLTLYYGTSPIIKNINAVIKCGEKIAIVGPNGAGKSTLVKALLGFTKFTGDMYFDGKNTNNLSWKSILRQISYIPQNDYTSDDTIINNLRLGNKNAKDDFIKDKARIFGVHNTFLDMEEGYETIAGPKGNKLSGGQLQKVSLIRAAVKDAPIFVLDEATAAMDKNYENDLIEKLFTVLYNKTIIMIVHGKEHLKRFDKIMFLNNGTLENVGTYKDLIKISENFRCFVK